MLRRPNSITMAAGRVRLFIGGFGLLIATSGCTLPKWPDQEFGDQNFKSAIAHVELHKTRTGAYPRDLEELETLGQWDQLWTDAVDYQPNGDGYDLSVGDSGSGARTFDGQSARWTSERGGRL
ncbi:MAG: hypothetical protein JRH14_10880 [Deltaproteobacteria bacterium]|nr:hypothetical protein [Deltaproteobacteria bacterium]MBW2686792.1 hypothetical protein [Deltaproteobacteria bacterium]